TDFGISLSNYTSLIENGQTLYLQNGEYTLKAVQTNSSSEYYFDFWNLRNLRNLYSYYFILLIYILLLYYKGKI
ncbi:MAG: hypothetical protein ACP5RD_06050, partial [bacterium]